MNQNNALPEPKREFVAWNNKEYKVKAIILNAIYGKEAKNQIPNFYYLILWKGYPEEKNTCEPSAIVKHLRKLINTFHKEYLEKSTATSPPLDAA